MSAYPSLELDDRTGVIAATRQFEDTVLHRFTRRTSAVSSRPQLGDRVLARVPLSPETIGFRITSVVRGCRYGRRLDFGTGDSIGDGPSAGRSRDDRHGADVNERRD